MKKVESPKKGADIPVAQVATSSADQHRQGSSVPTSEMVARDDYKARLPRIECATRSVSNDALLQTKPVAMGMYEIYQMPTCLVVVDTQQQRYVTFGFRDFVRKSDSFKQVVGTSQANLGFNVQVNESGLVILNLWKLKADCSKYRNDATCSNDETTYTQPLPWNASDEEWSRIGSIVEVASIDNFDPIPKAKNIASDAVERESQANATYTSDTQTSSVNSEVCKDFSAIKEYVSKNIAPSDSESSSDSEYLDWTLFEWKRKTSEPFISYPPLRLFHYVYGWKNDAPISHESEFFQSVTERNSKNIGSGIRDEAKRLGLVIDEINTLPLWSFPLGYGTDFSYVKSVFALRSDNGDLYSIYLSGNPDGGGAGAAGTADVSISCGRAVDTYDLLYDEMDLKAVEKTQDPYVENRVYGSVLWEGNEGVVASLDYAPTWRGDYYYHDGSFELMDNPKGSCMAYESRKIGKGVRCTYLSDDGKLFVRTAEY
ncbi:MAG: hypothetical protein WCJ25_03550 [Candidatus Moraniibacteriota bacterium]